MDNSLPYIPLTMVRTHLNDIPDFALPAGFRVRTFRTGDERHWADIETRAGEFQTFGEGLKGFEVEFGSSLAEMDTRSLILEADGVGPIGTTTAWFGDLDGQALGRIHWVAIVPEYHGRRLSKPLLSAAMRILAERHHAAFLTTQTNSWRAIGLYRSFGFEPAKVTDEDRRGWAIVEERLGAKRS